MLQHERCMGELLRRVQDGQAGAAEEFVALYGPHILRVVRRSLHRKLRPKFDSEDFVQAVWASFFADFGHLGARCQIRDIAAYLAAIAKHKTIDEVRRRLHTRKRVIYREVAWHRCGEARLAAVHKRLPEPMEAAEAKEAWSRLARGRSERSVQIFEMRRGGASHVEIAQHLGVNERTVRRVLDRAERRMKKRP